MKKSIINITLVVKDYDEAINYYTEFLHFKLIEDTPLGDGKRWVRISPSHDNESCLLLAQADGDNQIAAIGNQTGGRVFLFLQTDDFNRDYQSMQAKGVNFKELPRKEGYGTVAVFEDIYGNLWDLIEPK